MLCDNLAYADKALLALGGKPQDLHAETGNVFFVRILALTYAPVEVRPDHRERLAKELAEQIEGWLKAIAPS